MKFILTSRQVSLFLVTCLALMSAGVLAKGHSHDLFYKFSGNSLILKGGEPAINPATSSAYFFVFVDNENPNTGDGTFKNPYSTLAAAQAGSAPNAIIYVFPGDGTDKGMNTGFLLQAGQQFLGAGTKQKLETTVGCVKIPCQAKGLPVVSNSDFAATAPAHAAITASAGGNVVSGINFVDDFGGNTSSPFDPSVTSAGIRIENGLNYLIKHNVVSTNSNNGGGNSFNIYGGGNVTVLKNKFIGTDRGDTFGIDFQDLVAPFEGTFAFEKNLFTGADANSGLVRGLNAELGVDIGYNGELAIAILCNTSNSQTNTAMDEPTGIGVAAHPLPFQPIRTIIKGNHVTIPAGIACPTVAPPALGKSCSGILVSSFGPGTHFASLHKNVSITTGLTPGYLFANVTFAGPTPDPTALQLEFNDNVGTIQVL